MVKENSAADTFTAALNSVKAHKNTSELMSLYELARIGQSAHRKFLKAFIQDHDLTTEWELLLHRLVPQFSEVTNEEVVEKGWDNLLQVLRIIQDQGVSTALYEKLNAHVSSVRGASARNTDKNSTLMPHELILDPKTVYPCRGLDVGTVNIIGSYYSKADNKPHFDVQRNAFLDMRSDDFTREMLSRLNLKTIDLKGRNCVIGDGAFKLANIFQTKTRRPMCDGIISSQEEEALTVIEQIITQTIGPAENNEPCVFTVPANPVDADKNNVYHTGMLEMILRKLGYRPSKIDEGHSVVFAELQEQNYTGIGISCGGGMSNICVSYRSMPALSFSVCRGGDWIDRNVAESMDMPISIVTAVKEEGFNLLSPKDRVEEALAIYYRDMIRYTVETIEMQIAGKENMPIFNEPVEVVLCGGTSMVSGFVETFEQIIREKSWPVKISRVRLASDPLKTVSQGCLNAALEQLNS